MLVLGCRTYFETLCGWWTYAVAPFTAPIARIRWTRPPEWPGWRDLGGEGG